MNRISRSVEIEGGQLVRRDQPVYHKIKGIYQEGAAALGMDVLDYAVGCADAWYQECVALRKEIFELQSKLREVGL